MGKNQWSKSVVIPIEISQHVGRDGFSIVNWGQRESARAYKRSGHGCIASMIGGDTNPD